MATHSSVLAWRIPGTGEPGGLPSMGSHRVGHWSDLAVAAARAARTSRNRNGIEKNKIKCSDYDYNAEVPLSTYTCELVNFPLKFSAHPSFSLLSALLTSSFNFHQLFYASVIISYLGGKAWSFNWRNNYDFK